MKTHRRILPNLPCSVALMATLAGSALMAQESVEPDWTILETYCQECHNFEDYSGSVAFDILSRESLVQDDAVWEKAVRRMRTGLMPPAGEPRPERDEFNRFVTDLENRLDLQQAEQPNPGHEGLARLNRAEYINVIRDLLAFDASDIVTTLLPADEADEGFDNLADCVSNPD